MVNRIIYFIAILVFLIAGLTIEVNAATKNLADCSSATVSAAITAAASGDTLVCPAGSWTWGSAVTINKGLIFQGATTGCPGSCSGAGTSITGTLNLTLPGNVNVDVSQLTLIKGGIYLTNSSSSAIQNLRIHHNEFNTTSQAISNGSPVSGPIFGLIDHNKFTNTQGHAIKLYGSDAAEWSSYPPTDANRGTANSLYIEDNIFTGGIFSLGEGSGGMRMVFRYNTADISQLPNIRYLWDAHGIINNPNPNCDWEIYENTVTNFPSGIGGQLMNWRGGGLVAFNNQISGPSGGGWVWYWSIYLDDPNSSQCVYLPQNGYLWNNINSTNGYTYGMYNHNVSSCGGLGQKQAYWADFNEDGSNSANQLNSSYFKKGLFSARPASPTAQDVYWATDTRVLYRAKTAGTWTQVYKPYTYPHPLSLSTTPILLVPPAGIRVN